MLPPAPLALALLTASFEVQGTSTCPRPEQVKERLTEVGGDHLLELDDRHGPLHIRLFDERGTLVGERDLDRNSSCEELAEATAVLISAWTVEFPALELPELEPETALAAADPAPGDQPKESEAPPPAPIVRVGPAFDPTPFPVTSVSRALAPQNRSGMHDVDVGFSHSIGPRYTRSNGVYASYVWWFLDGAGIEAALNGQFDNGLNTLAEEVNLNFASEPPPLTDEHAPVFALSASGIGSFARGPTRLLGLIDGPSIELYGLFGLGVGVVRKDQIASPEFVFVEGPSSSWRPIFEGGAGMRIYAFREAVAFELEMRDLFFDDPVDSGFTHSLQLQGGLRVSADPAAWRARDVEGRPQRSLGGRLVITPSGGFSLADDFVTTRAISLSVAYDIFDFLAVETLGSWLFPTESALAEEILDAGRLTPELAKLVQLRWAVGGGVRINALRGRFAALGLPIDGDLTLYVDGGGGVGATRVQCTPGTRLDPAIHGPNAFCPSPPTVPTDGLVFVYEPDHLTGLGYVGGGFNLQLFDAVALTLEVKDYIFKTTVFRPDTTEPTQRLSEETRHILLGQIGASVVLF